MIPVKVSPVSNREEQRMSIDVAILMVLIWGFAMGFLAARAWYGNA